jgi:hypothetical protein
MSATTTTFDAFLKDNYGPGQSRVQELLYKDFSFLGFITKKTGVTAAAGRRLISPCVYTNGQGLSSGFTTGRTAANATGGSTRSQDWNVGFGDYFAFVDISDKLMKLSASDMGAYLESRKLEIDGLYNQWSQVMSRIALGDSGRNLGSFTISTGVCTLTNPDDVVNYQRGMLVNASANDGTATGHTLIDPSIGYVIAVNRNAGTFTVSAIDGGAAGTPANWTGTMYAFRYGDFGGTTTPNTIFDPFGSWVPAADPSATAFNGVDRTEDIVALSGVRLSAAEISGLSLESRIKRLLTRMANRGFGAQGVGVFLNPEKWQDLEESYESRGIRDRSGTTGIFGYKTLKVIAGGVEADVYAERFQPINNVIALPKEAFSINTPEEFPAVVNGDGLSMLRKVGANDYEFRLTAYPASLCTPGLCGRTTAP